jgi:hypothetical protein
MNTSNARPPRPGVRGKTNGTPASKAGRRAAGPSGGAAPDSSAGFCVLAPPAAAVPAWPVHPLLWLEPDFGAILPATSGLRVERSYGVPAAGFITERKYFTRRAAAAFEGRPVGPRLAPEICRSGLLPLEREPRTLLATHRDSAHSPARLATKKDQQ